MKPRLLMTLALIALFGCDRTDPSKPAASRTSPAATTAPAAMTANCVICVDHVIEVEPSTPRLEFEGQTYHFCSDYCKATFEKNPEKYRKPPTSKPAAPAPGHAVNAWEEDLVHKQQLEATGQAASNDTVVIWYPAGALSGEEVKGMLDELAHGILAAKRWINRPDWSYGGDQRIHYYLPDAKFISHAPGGNCAFIPLWRMKERQAPWLHESLHLLLKSDKGDWLKVEDERAQAHMPLWLHEGLADALAIDISQEEGLKYYSPRIDVPADQLDTLAVRAMRESPSPDLLDSIGGRGKPAGLFGPDREKYALPFYAGSASFVRYIARTHGYQPLLAAIDDFEHENQTLESLVGESIGELKKQWLKQIGFVATTATSASE